MLSSKMTLRGDRRATRKERVVYALFVPDSMAEDEDDYLSDKFLLESTAPAPPKTYIDRRKEALKRSQIKNEQNKIKSRRERELESREEGLSKSLFERAAEEQASSSGGGNKALSMMLKMGFKPGQALGRSEDGVPSPGPSRELSVSSPGGPAEAESVQDSPSPEAAPSDSVKPHRVVPLPLNEWLGVLFRGACRQQAECERVIWVGKKGIGLGKRAASPSTLERAAKAAKTEEDTSQESFRDRTRREFEQRRAEGRLAPAQRTCSALDEKAGITVSRTPCFPCPWLDYLYLPWDPVQRALARPE